MEQYHHHPSVYHPVSILAHYLLHFDMIYQLEQQDNFNTFQALVASPPSRVDDTNIFKHLETQEHR